MNPPSKVQVGTSVYTLALVDADRLDSSRYAECDTLTEEIFINKAQGLGQMQDSVLHEVLHGVFNRAGIRIGSVKEERSIAQLVPWLLLMLQDNPQLVKYLTEKVK